MRGRVTGWLLGSGLLGSGLLAPGRVEAHAADVGKPPDELLRTFTLDLWVLVPSAIVLALYARGWLRARRAGRRPSPWRALALAGAVLVVTASICSPLDALGAALFSAHMTQHLVLVSVAAPLAALARPGPVLAWGIGPTARRGLARALRVGRPLRAPIRSALRGVAHPASAFLLHVVAVWAWHLPALYEAALRDDRVHALEHGLFVATAWLFWRAILVAGRPSGMGHGLAVLFAFAATVQGAVLGAVLASARVPWYRAHAPEGFGLTLLEDQQLAGLLMWVPGGLPYVLAGVLSFGAWLRASEAAASRSGPWIQTEVGGRARAPSVSRGAPSAGLGGVLAADPFGVRSAPDQPSTPEGARP